MEPISDEFMREKYETFLAGCEDGDPTACYSLGEYFAVVEENKTKAVEIFEKNCRSRTHGSSCFSLGRLYCTSSLHCMRRSSARAQSHHLSLSPTIHLLSRVPPPVRGQGGLEKSSTKALASWERGCVEGAHGQCCDFADLAQSVQVPPEGIRRSPARAMKMATRGCDLEFAPSCYRLACAYLTGAGPYDKVRKSGPKALDFMRKACDLGYGAACFNLAKMYNDGDIDGVPKNLVKSHEFAERTSSIEKASRAAMGVPEQ